MSSRKVGVSQLRGPWVPAPAKSSGTMTPTGGGELSASKVAKGFILPLPILNASTSSSYSSMRFRQKTVDTNAMNAMSQAKPKYKSASSTNVTTTSSTKRKESKQVVVRKPTLKIRPKNGGRRVASSYKLQSKDSLVDVTACLQAKREEVMKIWENNLTKNDPDLLTLIEKANRLALEAAEEVNLLRRTIQDFQKTDNGLTDDDCTMLNNMRTSVLQKVREFEEVDNKLRDIIARKSASRTSLISESSKTSQTEMERTPLAPEAKDSKTSSPRPETNEMLVIKTRNPAPLSAASASYTEVDSDEEVHPRNKAEMKVHDRAGGDYLSDKSAVASASVSLENLNRLKMLYEESLTFPQIEEISGITLTPVAVPKPLSRSQSCGHIEVKGARESFHHHHHHQQQQQQQHQRSVRFTETTIRSDSETLQESIQSVNVADELYQQKISRLQRKLMDTEQEVEELKSEIERIESDANFRVRMLQNNVQDKFESLAIIPEYLQMVELKIQETAQLKTKLQNDANEKDRLIQVERESNAKLKKENGELRESLRVAESTKELLTFKNYELEKSNVQLRKEIDDMAKKYTDMAAILRDTDSYTNARAHECCSPVEMQKLRLQCSELKDKLSQSKRIIQSIRKSKEKMTVGLNDKIEELMDALQEAQHHKRILGDQIRFLKKSYHELFPTLSDAFSVSSSKKKSKTSKHRSRRKPVVEPKVEAKVAWQTGSLNKEAFEKATSSIIGDLMELPPHTKNSMYEIVTGSENEESS